MANSEELRLQKLCKDGKEVDAHKVVLASTSPFFLELFQRNKHPHPLVFMKGIKGEDLLAMVEFLYIGEVNVGQENLDTFLALAEELKLKGLDGSESEGENTKYKIVSPTKRVKTVGKQILGQIFKSEERALDISGSSYHEDLDLDLDLDIQIRKIMDMSEKSMWKGRKYE